MASLILAIPASGVQRHADKNNAAARYGERMDRSDDRHRAAGGSRRLVQGRAHQAEVLSGLGGSLTVLGILVAAQPYIRKGVRQAGRKQASLDSMGDRKEPEQQDAKTEAVRHVVKERVVGVLLVGIGSLLNGYGPALSSALHMKGA